MSSKRTIMPIQTHSDPVSGVSPVERLHALVAADMHATDRLIHGGMGSTVDLIPTLARHLIDSGGKRLRPMLTLAAARMGG
jgi:octaprenyl-diphosphate synthase